MKSIANTCPFCGEYVDPRDLICYNCDEDEVTPCIDVGVANLHRGEDHGDSAEDDDRG